MRFTLCLIAVLPSLILARTASAEKLSNPIFRHATYAQAWDSSKESGKPMLVFVTMEECHFCQKMKDETLSRRNIQGTVGSAYEAVSIQRSHCPELVKKFGVRIFPTTFIVDAEGKIVDRMEGYLNHSDFEKHLRPANRTVRVSSNP